MEDQVIFDDLYGVIKTSTNRFILYEYKMDALLPENKVVIKGEETFIQMKSYKFDKLSQKLYINENFDTIKEYFINGTIDIDTGELLSVSLDLQRNWTDLTRFTDFSVEGDFLITADPSAIANAGNVIIYDITNET